MNHRTIKNMVTSTITSIIHCDIHNVWNAVVQIESYPLWRSDLKTTEIRNQKQFLEYTNDGYVTTFTTTLMDPCRRWELDMENKHIQGHWIGIFACHEKGTEICFTEHVIVKNLFLRLFAKSFLQQAQNQFIEDLKKYCHRQFCCLENC